MEKQAIDNGVESPTEIPGVELLLCHFTKGELEGLDNLQGGPSIDDDTGLREYSKLSIVIEDPKIQEIFRHVQEELGDDGKVSPDLHNIYKLLKTILCHLEKHLKKKNLLQKRLRIWEKVEIPN